MIEDIGSVNRVSQSIDIRALGNLERPGWIPKRFSSRLIRSILRENRLKGL
jgi:hypothetical protein